MRADLERFLGRTGLKRVLVRLLLLLLAIGVVLELFARLVLGMGDPPLVVADPEIEYLFAPSTHYQRFGREVSYNRYSMRSEDFPAHKTDPSELRIMVLGDSVVNGGAITDQKELASSRLKEDLTAKLGRPVVVGNISAGSWGPPNLLAYVKRFGFFDADSIFVVISSHDYADVPTFDVVGRHRNFPDKKPILALQEAAFRYLPRFTSSLERWFLTRAGVKLKPPVPTQEMIDQSLEALRELLERARASGADVVLFQHWDVRELGDEKMPGYTRIGEVARAAGVPVVQLGPAFVQAVKEGKAPYRDNIHPSVYGQALMAKVLEETLLLRLESKH